MSVDERTKDELPYWKYAVANIQEINEELLQITTLGEKIVAIAISLSVDKIDESEKLTQYVKDQYLIILDAQKNLDQFMDLVLGRLKMVQEEEEKKGTL